MLELGRHPAHEEIEAIIARARLMRSLFVGALITRGTQRVKQLLAGAKPQPGDGARRFYPDMG